MTWEAGSSVETVAAAIRTIFAQPDADHVRSQLAEVTSMLAPKFANVAAMVDDAAEDLLAFISFPHALWRKIWSTSTLERLDGDSPGVRSVRQVPGPICQAGTGA